MPTESPKLLALSSVYSAGIQPLAGTTGSQQLCHGGSAAWLIGSGTVEERRSQPGVQERGQSPMVFFLPLVPSLVQMHIHLLWSFGLLFPRYDLPLPDSLLLSHSLPLSVSLYLCFCHPRLPHGPSCLHLNPSSSLSFLVSVSSYFRFCVCLRGAFHKKRKK